MLEWPEPAWIGGHWVPEQVEAAGGTDVWVCQVKNLERLLG